MAEPVSIRYNNPGALNTVAWVRAMPGYLGENVTTPGNSTAKFDTPEHGVAAYYKLLQMYRSGGHKTLMQIVNRYGGGQDYSQYVKFVCDKTGFEAHKEISLTDDSVLLPFAKAMFWYEAGKRTPLLMSKLWQDLIRLEVNRK